MYLTLSLILSKLKHQDCPTLFYFPVLVLGRPRLDNLKYQSVLKSDRLFAFNGLQLVQVEGSAMCHCVYNGNALLHAIYLSLHFIVPLQLKGSCMGVAGTGRDNWDCHLLTLLSSVQFL